MAADASEAVVVDRVLPVAVVVSSSGDIGPVYTWGLSPTHRGRQTATGAALTSGEIQIASPAAGGVISIDRSSSEYSLTMTNSPRLSVTDRNVDTIDWPLRDPSGRVAMYPADLVYYDEERIVQKEKSGELRSFLRADLGEEQHTARLPQGFGADYVVSQSLIWFWTSDRPTLVVIEPTKLHRRWIQVTIDTAGFAPDLFVPDVDLAAYEHEQLGLLRAIFDGESGGAVAPHDLGLSFESIDLADEFPYTQIVGIYTDERVAGLRFGRRWRLYDDLGNIEDLGDVWLEFHETLVTDRYSDTDADADRIVWIGSH